MIPGTNKIYEHAGKQYHIQAEDLGVDHGCFEVRIYDGGAVLWRKQISYQDVLARSLPRLEQEEVLRTLMDKTIHTVQAAISKGKLP